MHHGQAVHHRDGNSLVNEVRRVCRIDPEVITRLQHVAETPFKRLPYTNAIEMLKTAVDGGHKFENNEIVWGMDMASEHERCSPMSHEFRPRKRCS